MKSYRERHKLLQDQPTTAVHVLEGDARTFGRSSNELQEETNGMWARFGATKIPFYLDRQRKANCEVMPKAQPTSKAGSDFSRYRYGENEFCTAVSFWLIFIILIVFTSFQDNEVRQFIQSFI